MDSHIKVMQNEMQRKLIVGMDVDDVLAPFIGKFIELNAEKFPEGFETKDVADWKMSKYMYGGVTDESIYDLFDNERLYSDLRPFPEAYDILSTLCERYKVVIITAVPEFAKEWRREWLSKHFPFINKEDVYLCSDKNSIPCDVLVDDRPKNLREFEGYTVKMKYPYNAHVNVDYEIDCLDQLHLVLKDIEKKVCKAA